MGKVVQFTAGERVRYELAALKADPKLMGGVIGRMVRVWSGEHNAYWRPSGYGYTTEAHLAAYLPFDAAWERTSYMGADKKIAFEVME